MRAREGGGSAIGLALGAMILGAMPALPQAAWAQTAPVYSIPRAATPVRVDGVLDEEAWKNPLQSHLFSRVAAQKEFFEGVTYDKKVGEMFFNIRPTGDFTCSLGGNFGDAVDDVNQRPGRLLRLVPEITLDLGRHFHLQVDNTIERLNARGGRLHRANLAREGGKPLLS